MPEFGTHPRKQYMSLKLNPRRAAPPPRGVRVGEGRAPRSYGHPRGYPRRGEGRPGRVAAAGARGREDPRGADGRHPEQAVPAGAEGPRD